MSTVNFKPRPGKPHLLIRGINSRHYYLEVVGGGGREAKDLALSYALKATPRVYKTRGEAARALFSYKHEVK